MPRRTATGVAVFTWAACVFLAGASDRSFVQAGVPYEEQIWFWRGAAFVLPVLAFLLTRRLCVELGDSRRRAPARIGAERS